MSSTKLVLGDYTIQSLNGNVNIVGNLIVSGSQTAVEQTTISDNVITLNAGQTGAGVSTVYIPMSAPGSGIGVDRGSLPKVAVVWNEGIGTWQYTNDGSFYQDLGSGGGGGGNFIANVTAATKANPVQITTLEDHGFVDGEYVTFTGLGGMVELNGNSYYTNVLTANTFTLYSDNALTTTINGTGFTTYTSGGKVVGSSTSVHSDPRPSLGGNLNLLGHTIYDSTTSVVLSTGSVGTGKTGLYVATPGTAPEELVTNKAALTYGIIFG
jgi:hypothetical protein